MTRGIARLLTALILSLGLSAGARALDLEKLDESVVRVWVPINKNEASIGTGFVINSRNVITNHHVIAQAGSEIFVIIKGSLNNRLPARIVIDDPLRDLAVLEVTGLRQPPVPLSTGEPHLGDRVYAFGYPGIGDRLDTATSATLNTGAISRIFSAPWSPDTRLSIRLIQHEASINPGNSGGPLFNACGEVIGVNTQTSPSKVFRDERGNVRAVVAGTGIYFASHASELVTVLRSRNIPFENRIDRCVPEAAAGAGSALPGWALPSMVAWSAGATGIAVIALVFALRRPRERIVKVVGSASRVIARSFKVGSAASARARAPAPASAKPSSLWDVVKPAGGAAATSMPPPAKQVSPASAAGAAPSGQAGRGWTLNGNSADGSPVSLRIDENRLRASGAGLVLGRHDELSDVVIANPALSRRHARLSLQGETLMVEDLNSANGTVNDGARLQPYQPVALGKSLVLGDLRLEVRRG